MKDRLQDIFEHKVRSSDHFREVQRKHGLIHTPENLKADPFTREGAIELHKGLHWINLELAEFIEAPPAAQAEELADVLHFLVEFCLLIGFSWEEIPDNPEVGDRLEVIFMSSFHDPFVFEDAHANVRFTILTALRIADVLKNKPWKQTLRTDLDMTDLQVRIRALWYWYGATVRTAKVTPEELYQAFLKKELVNFERISTGV